MTINSNLVVVVAVVILDAVADAVAKTSVCVKRE